jgi:hypothetical protein
VVYDHDGGHCDIADSVLDSDAKSGCTSTTSADSLKAFVKEKALPVPGDTRLYMYHDYTPDTREPVWETTVAEQRPSNMDVRI